MILLLFLDLCWIFVNLPVKSLGSNISNDKEAIRSKTIPSCPWFWLSRSRFWSWITEWPLQWFEPPLSATRLVVLLTSSKDMFPLWTHSEKSDLLLIKAGKKRLHYDRFVRRKKSPRKTTALQKLLEGPWNPWFHFPLLLVHILVSNFFFLYTTSIQWRESELIAVLLQVHSSSEISGSACDYHFLNILLW